MALQDGQLSIRGLVMGKDTPYQVFDFNPWTRQARAESTGRAWAHGAWSGAEWQGEAIVPIRVSLTAPSRHGSEWLRLHQQLVAAFRPVGDSGEEVELRWRIGEQEYVLFGRPRSAEVQVDSLRVPYGQSRTAFAFAALDPLIYSGTESSTVLSLPTYDGGLTVALTPPVTVDATAVGGTANLTNIGTAPAPLHIRLDGPLEQPWIAVQDEAGNSVLLRFDITLLSGQWLDVDTGERTVLIQGLQSRRGVVSGEWPLLPPGDAREVEFRASAGSGTATVTHRSVWW